MQKFSWFVRVSAVSTLALILAVAAVGGSSANAEAAAAATGTAAAPAPINPVCFAAKSISEVRLVHASPNSPNVDIYIDKAAKPQYPNVAFGKFTGYVGIVAGVHRVTITKAGDAKTVVFDQDVELTGQTAYTLIAEGTLANFRVDVLVDDLSDTAGMARVEVVHAVPDAPAVDVITTKDNKAIVSNLAYPNSAELNLDVVAMAEAALPPAATPKAGATAAATPVPPTGVTLDLAVTAHGSTTPLIALPKTKLEADTIYTVIAVGLVGDKTNKAVKLEALVLTATSLAGFQAPPAPATPAAPAATMAATMAAPAATMAATMAAPAATMAATKSASVNEAALAATSAATAAPTMAATAAAPTATKIPVGQEPASAGWALKTGTVRRLTDYKRCVGVAGITVAGGPADVAGVKTGDLVLTVDGTELTSAEQFQTILSGHKSGDKIKVTLQHADGSTGETTITLGLNPFS
jgi:hypothetical protein